MVEIKGCAFKSIILLLEDHQLNFFGWGNIV